MPDANSLPGVVVVQLAKSLSFTKQFFDSLNTLIVLDPGPLMFENTKT
jgi:hypothetical protein